MRKYLPTFADLIDRLSIVLMKSIFIDVDSYIKEIDDIKHDIDVLLRGKHKKINSDILFATLVIMLINRYIWENESIARQGGSDQDKLLKLTHSLNGRRNTAKNVINREFGERVDFKIDCLAEELVKEYGNWQIFRKEEK